MYANVSQVPIPAARHHHHVVMEQNARLTSQYRWATSQYQSEYNEHDLRCNKIRFGGRVQCSCDPCDEIAPTPSQRDDSQNLHPVATQPPRFRTSSRFPPFSHDGCSGGWRSENDFSHSRWNTKTRPLLPNTLHPSHSQHSQAQPFIHQVHHPHTQNLQAQSSSQQFIHQLHLPTQNLQAQDSSQQFINHFNHSQQAQQQQTHASQLEKSPVSIRRHQQAAQSMAPLPPPQHANLAAPGQLTLAAPDLSSFPATTLDLSAFADPYANASSEDKAGGSQSATESDQGDAADQEQVAADCELLGVSATASQEE